MQVLCTRETHCSDHCVAVELCACAATPEQYIDSAERIADDQVTTLALLILSPDL
jgi:hypothetical protein